MRNYLKMLPIVALMLIQINIKAQLTPQQAIKGMMRGINIGNTLEPPQEGTWGNPALKKRAFSDYKNAGFTAIRIPITWDAHTGKGSPYKITDSWMSRIDSVVTWGLSQHLLIIINAHHEGWLKDNFTTANIDRFDSIWSQISARFKDRSDSLIFEMINEPHPADGSAKPITKANVDSLNKRILKTIRKTNPTRIVIFSGQGWSSVNDMVDAAIPDTTDEFLMAYYHSYDPYPFGLNGPGTYGSDADIKATKGIFEMAKSWSDSHKIPVILGEFGYMKNCEYNSRMCAYATVVDFALTYGIGAFAWDDGGDFPIYNRNNYVFNDIKDILIKTYNESPNRLTISNYADTLIKLKWNSRTAENDSIVVERGSSFSGLTSFAKLAPSATEFIDTTVATGKTYYYRLRADFKDSIELQSQPVMLNNAKITRGTYQGKIYNIPGTIEAENFDTGIEGNVYHDTDKENLGKYRLSVGTDINQIGGVYYLTNNTAGEWQEYTVNVSKAGTYALTAYVAAASDNGEFTVKFGENAPVTFSAIKTNSMTSFGKIVNTLELNAGSQLMRVDITKTGDFNINKYNFALQTAIVQAQAEKNDITIFPNPAVKVIQLNNVSQNTQIEIYNILGNLVLQSTLSGNNTVNIEKLQSGVYYLKGKNATQTFNLPFIKQ